MNTENLKLLLDSCFLAKRIVETLPELPHGMKPRHIHVLDAIGTIQDTQVSCRVSDVSTALNITMPSITKLIQELTALKLVEKYSDECDKRAALLRLTEQGQLCVKHHVTDFHRKWAEALNEIPDETAYEIAEVMEKLWQTMPGRLSKNSFPQSAGRKDEKKNDRKK